MQVINLAQDATPIATAAAATSFQIAAKNTLLFDLTVSNDSGADFVMQAWDVAAAGDIGGASADATPDFEETVLAGSFLPFGFNGGYQFHRGLYVRAVTAKGGSTLIGTASMRVAGRQITPYPLSV